MFSIKSLLALGLAVAYLTDGSTSFGSSAPIFRWNDSIGTPVFSDRAPSTKRPYVILTPGTRPSPGMRGAASTPEPPQFHASRSDDNGISGASMEDEKIEMDLLSPEQRVTHCNNAYAMRDAIASGRRLFWRDSEGQRVWLTESMKEKQRLLANTLIKHSC